MTFPRPQIDPLAIQEAWQRVGFTLWQVQRLEETVAVYLALVHRLQPGVAREEAESVLEKTRRRILGQLLSELKDKPAVPAALVERLDLFVPERNWLAHRSRHDSHLVFYRGRSGSAEFGERLDRIADEALWLMKGFATATEDHLIALGRSRADLEAETRRVLTAWGAA